MMIDLHCHSTASDGALTPETLVERAKGCGISLLALTDHDTVEGLSSARQQAKVLGLRLINGVELSCQWGGATVHVLGYDFDLQAPALNEALTQLHQGRWQRAETIATRLAAKGMPGALEGARQIQLATGLSNNAPARPHFAEFLVQAGYVRDRNEAFRKWLGAGKLGDIKQHWPSLEQTLCCLKDSGAWISLAHPLQYDFTRSKRRQLVKAFVEQGGHALEVVNGVQPADQVSVLGILAREFELKVTAGSDFHGPGEWSELGLYRAVPEDLPPLWPHFRQDAPDARI